MTASIRLPSLRASVIKPIAMTIQNVVKARKASESLNKVLRWSCLAPNHCCLNRLGHSYRSIVPFVGNLPYPISISRVSQTTRLVLCLTRTASWCRPQALLSHRNTITILSGGLIERIFHYACQTKQLVHGFGKFQHACRSLQAAAKEFVVQNCFCSQRVCLLKDIDL